MVCYLGPSDRATTRYVEAEMADQPRAMELIVVGYLNVDIYRTVQQGQDEDIAAAVVTAGLEKISAHFLP